MSSKSSADVLKEKGNEYFRKQNYKDAILYYTVAIKKDPKHYLCLTNRAAAYLHLNEYALALADCQKAISIDEKKAKAHNRMGSVYFHMKKFPEAVEAHRRAIAIEPNNEAYQNDLQNAELELKNVPLSETVGVEKAIKIDDKLSREQQKQPTTTTNFISHMNKISEAVSHCRAIAKDPNNMTFQDLQNDQLELMKDPLYKTADQMLSKPEMAEVGRKIGEKMFACGDNMNPFGPMSQEKMEKIDALSKNNPKIKAISDDFEQNGMAALDKYKDDPDLKNFLASLTEIITQP